jgi:cell division initiation protein
MMLRLTPLDIQQKQFKTRFRGFDIREVDAFLDEMADAFEAIQLEKESLQDEVRRMEMEVQGYRKREETFKRAMLNSQTVLEQMKANAQKQAEVTVAEAEVHAEKILNRAHNRLAQLHDDINELKRQRIQIEVQIGSVIESHRKLLKASQDGMQAMDAEDSKVALLTAKPSTG